jgi:hypothetical protein
MYTLQLNTLKSICMYVCMYVCLCVGGRNRDKVMNTYMILGIVVTLLVPSSSTYMMSGKLFLQDVCLIEEVSLLKVNSHMVLRTLVLSPLTPS